MSSPSLQYIFHMKLVKMLWKLFNSAHQPLTRCSKLPSIFHMEIYISYLLGTVLVGLNDPLIEWPLLFIHKPLSHTIWLLMSDPLADVTNDQRVVTETPHFTLYQQPDHKLTKQIQREWKSRSQHTVEQSVTLPRWLNWLSTGQPVENSDIPNDLLWPCQCFVIALELENTYWTEMTRS